jgi:hypothetical protein
MMKGAGVNIKLPTLNVEGMGFWIFYRRERRGPIGGIFKRVIGRASNPFKSRK